MTEKNETIATAEKPQTRRPRKMAREPKASNTPATSAVVPSPTSPRRDSKTDLVLGMLQRSEGATIDQLVTATGWLPHTTRATLTGLRKRGHALVSDKLDGVRRYRVDEGGAA